MRIYIVDDHCAIRRGVAHLLGEVGFSVVGEAGTCAEAKAALCQEDWDMALLDIQLPDGDGIEILEYLRKQGIDGPVLVHSMLPDVSAASRVFRAGGNGFINKACSPEELIRAANQVARGGRYVSPEFAAVLAMSQATGNAVLPHDTLSPRELEALRLIGQGKTTTQVATLMGCNSNTVSTYRSRILKKLELKTTMDLMRYAISNGLVSL